MLVAANPLQGFINFIVLTIESLETLYDILIFFVYYFAVLKLLLSHLPSSCIVCSLCSVLLSQGFPFTLKQFIRTTMDQQKMYVVFLLRAITVICPTAIHPVNCLYNFV